MLTRDEGSRAVTGGAKQWHKLVVCPISVTDLINKLDKRQEAVL